ncbi:methyltransferase domain-containing protein [Streptomyces armeniacus]|uniref:Methyltransferase domain-containing protein n=1 Tax=Streptomyces armeniacus TaxID=83291 RepID=A0A345XTI3_9ACTN|nr:HemK2/MTQ2 family protein methyltransferase [Streptomyces armeniacus]AXK34949.1 methyltransferase domain-containing protein [Streptomyces armeniacus]
MTTTCAPLPELGRAVTLPGVYAPQADSLLLADAVRRERRVPGSDLLDVCTGSGALAVYAARLGACVTAVDIGRRAVLTARLNALLAARRVVVRRGDLLSALPPDRTFDMLISNPPYVPSPAEFPPRRGRARSWDAGWDGRAFVDRVCDASPSALRTGGVLLMVHSALSAPETTVRRLAALGLVAEISDRATVPFGPVLSARLPWLRENGLVDDAAENQEELVVIRAEKI